MKTTAKIAAVFFVVFGIAPLANALTVSLSLDGANPAPEEVDVLAGQVLSMYVISDSDGVNYWKWIHTNNPATISNVQSYPAAGNLASITDFSDTYTYPIFKLEANDSAGNIQAGKHFSFDLIIAPDAMQGTIRHIWLDSGPAPDDYVILNVVPRPPKTYYADAAEGSDNNDGLSPETAFATIQKAIDSAFDGDTVLVADGTYTGPGNRDIDFLGKAITLQSENGPESCIIDCNGTPEDNHRGFYFQSGEDGNSVLDGFTITNGHAGEGGGIYCEVGSPTIINCVFSGNFARWGGGGMYNRESNPTLINCTFNGNSAANAVGGMANSDSNSTLINCIFNGNSARSVVGGMANSYSNSTLINCTFNGNSADMGNGGMSNFESSSTLINCIFSANMAHESGDGGMFNGYSNSTLINCIFTGNKASTVGGGMSNHESNLTLINCTFSGNLAKLYGGGIFNVGSNQTISNCTFAENSAPNGKAFACDSYKKANPSNIQLTNCILADGGDEILNNDDSNIAITYSNIQGGWEGEGNIDAEPCFALSTDYHLMPGSPCINAGDPNYTAEPNETDLEGKPRIIGGRIDMGAYEYYPNSPSIAVSAVSFYFVQGWPKPDPQTLLIRNCGDKPLQWEILEDCNWLHVTPTLGVSTGQINEITLTADTNSLVPGYYGCILTVLDPNASNNPVTVWVALRVGSLLRVPSQEFPTIQAAIDAAVDYDMVLVADGIYTGPGNRDIDFRGKAITVRSESGPENCIIDRNGTWEDRHRGFYFHNNENHNAVVEGFTITNGNEWRGGGIYCEESSPTISNCIITGNTAHDGGGIYCYYGNTTITNCTITGNSANWGAGICCYYGSTTINNCTITGNSAEGEYAYGGGILCAGDEDGNDTFTFSNCTITGNSATWGGGICCGYSSTTIANCILWGNEAPNGPELYLAEDSNALVNYTDVQGGQTDVYVEPGGVLNWDSSNIDLDPCFVQPGYWDANDTPDDVNDDFWIEGDYYLLPDSPCIDSGDNNSVPADIHDLDGDGNTAEPLPFDLDGNPRFVDRPDIEDTGNGTPPIVDMGAYEAMVSCFGVNHVKLGTKAGKKGNKVELKGTFDPASPINFAVDDVTYTIDDGLDYMLTFIIPAGSFELEGKGDKDKYKFHSPKGSVPDIKAKFDFLKCKFELKVKEVMDTSEITAETLAIVLQAGANIAQEIVELEVKGKKGEHLEYKRKPKFECCPEM